MVVWVTAAKGVGLVGLGSGGHGGVDPAAWVSSTPSLPCVGDTNFGPQTACGSGQMASAAPFRVSALCAPSAPRTPVVEDFSGLVLLLGHWFAAPLALGCAPPQPHFPNHGIERRGSAGGTAVGCSLAHRLGGRVPAICPCSALQRVSPTTKSWW